MCLTLCTNTFSFHLQWRFGSGGSRDLDYVRRVIWRQIFIFFLFGCFLKEVPASSVFSAANQFCCKAQEIFCGRKGKHNFSLLLWWVDYDSFFLFGLFVPSSYILLCGLKSIKLMKWKRTSPHTKCEKRGVFQCRLQLHDFITMTHYCDYFFKC